MMKTRSEVAAGMKIVGGKDPEVRFRTPDGRVYFAASATIDTNAKFGVVFDLEDEEGGEQSSGGDSHSSQEHPALEPEVLEEN